MFRTRRDSDCCCSFSQNNKNITCRTHNVMVFGRRNIQDIFTKALTTKKKVDVSRSGLLLISLPVPHRIPTQPTLQTGSRTWFPWQLRHTWIQSLHHKPIQIHSNCTQTNPPNERTTAAAAAASPTRNDIFLSAAAGCQILCASFYSLPRA